MSLNEGKKLDAVLFDDRIPVVIPRAHIDIGYNSLVFDCLYCSSVETITDELREHSIENVWVGAACGVEFAP